jgi:hypothetical protein
MEVVDGALRVKHESHHPASPTLPIRFRDAEFTFRFRFVKGNGSICRFEDAPRVSDTTFYLCRIEVLKKQVRLLLDQTVHDKERRAKKILATKKSSFADSQWHTVRIVFEGDSLLAQLDNISVLKGRHP